MTTRRPRCRTSMRGTLRCAWYCIPTTQTAPQADSHLHDPYFPHPHSILLMKKQLSRKILSQALSLLPKKKPMTRKTLHQDRSLLPMTKLLTRRQIPHQTRSLLPTRKHMTQKNLPIARSLPPAKSSAPPLKDFRLRNQKPGQFVRTGNVMKKGSG